VGELFSLLLQRRRRLDEFLLYALTGKENGLGILQSNGAPSTRALIFAKAVSRVVEVSSLKGENPHSSVVPSCSIGM
jgi:hypothetical protein